MRGLAPWPTGVGRLTAEYDVAGRVNTTSNWFLYTSSTPADVSNCDAIVNAWYVLCAGHIQAVSSSAAVLTACSVTISSPTFASLRKEVFPITGHYSGAQALNVAAGWKLIGSTRGRGTASVQRMPSCPDEFVDDSQRLSSVGYTKLRDEGNSYLIAFRTIGDGSGGFIVPGCLHRISAGAPLIPPHFDITLGLVPSAHLLTIRRRLPIGRQVSP